MLFRLPNILALPMKMCEDYLILGELPCPENESIRFVRNVSKFLLDIPAYSYLFTGNFVPTSTTIKRSKRPCIIQPVGDDEITLVEGPRKSTAC
jgi:hypothetical protein